VAVVAEGRWKEKGERLKGTWAGRGGRGGAADFGFGDGGTKEDMCE
jgi:hypothetical protein